MGRARGGNLGLLQLAEKVLEVRGGIQRSTLPGLPLARTRASLGRLTRTLPEVAPWLVPSDVMEVH